MAHEHWHAGTEEPAYARIDTTNAYEEFDSAVDALAEMIEGVGGGRAERKAQEIRDAADTEADYMWRFDNQRWVIFACELEYCDL